MFAAVAPDDTRKEVESMASKVLKMKLWPDETGATVRDTTRACPANFAAETLIEVEAKCSRYRGRSPLW